MKKLISLVLFLAIGLSIKTTAQEIPVTLNTTRESPGNFSVSADLVSSYVWRGSKFGSGPALQPTVEFTAGGFTLGAWGSTCLSDPEALETDLYTSYNFGKFTLGLTDYYFPGTAWFTAENHAFEVNSGLTLGNFSLAANYILNEGAGSDGGDVYVEAGFTAGKVNLFAGGGSGWHTPDRDFNICNLGLSTTKEIRITEHFTLPLSGSVVLNPTTEQFFLVAGITL
jgi:hypothetical protein